MADRRNGKFPTRRRGQRLWLHGIAQVSMAEVNGSSSHATDRDPRSALVATLAASALCCSHAAYMRKRSSNASMRQGQVAFQSARCHRSGRNGRVESRRHQRPRLPRSTIARSRSAESTYRRRTASPSRALTRPSNAAPPVARCSIGTAAARPSLAAKTQGEPACESRRKGPGAPHSARRGLPRPAFAGRKGHEYDDVTPTYDKNLGRDPCRRY